MSRKAGELTVAIRKLLDANPELTHLASRPLLKKKGFAPAKKPPSTTKSDNYKKFTSYEVDHDKPESIKAVGDACGFDAPTLKAVLVEVRWHKEVNNFNVSKSNWKKLPKPVVTPVVVTEEPKKRGRPKGSKNKNAAPAAVSPKPKPKPKKSKKQQRRGRKAKNVIPAEELAAFADVESRGGLEGVQKEIDEAHALIAELEVKVGLVKNLRERVAA